MEPVATIHELARYPVKSMMGELLSSAAITLQGIPHDRRFAFVQAASRSGFPWLTARELPDMLRHRAAVDATGSPEPVVRVTAPGGQVWPVTSEELRRSLEAGSGRSLFLLHDDRGSYDVAPISIISRQTVAQIATESGTVENPRRFRPNLLIDLAGAEPFAELQWVGRVLRIGTARIAITEVDKRCVMITLDPGAAVPNPAVLRSVAQQHGSCAGIYATVLTAGEIRTGDTLALEP